MGDERRTSERIIMVLLLEDDDDDDDDGEEEWSRLEEEARAVELDDEARVNMGPGRFLRLRFFFNLLAASGELLVSVFLFFPFPGSNGGGVRE